MIPIKKKALRSMVLFLSIYLAFMATLFILFVALVLAGEDREELTQIMTMLIPLMILPLALTLALFGCGKYTGTFDKYVAALNEVEREQFAREIESGYQIKGAVLTSQCVVITAFMRVAVVPYDQLVWIYKSQQFVYFMKIRQLVMVTADKKQQYINLGRAFDSMTTEEFMRRLAQKRPNVLIGYDEEKARMFRKDFERMKLLAGAVPRS